MDSTTSGNRQNLDHEIVLTREGRRVRVVLGGETIADSEDAITLHETDHRPVYYLPRVHVRMDRLVRSAYRTHCPYKGDASYFSLAGIAENAVWSYEDPPYEVALIKDRVAFYPDSVDAITTD